MLFHQLPNPDDKNWKDVYYRWLDQQKNKAQGGRIGFANGTTYEDFQQFMKEREEMYQGRGKQDILRDWERYKRFKQYGSGATQEAAQGGRIGYRYGKSYRSKDESSEIMKQVKALVESGLVQDEREALELILGSKSYGVTDEPYEFSPGALEDLRSRVHPSQIKENPFYRKTPNIDPGFERPMPEGWETARAQGGRIRAQEGGLMNLGGMEKDYREDGGFVPLGGEEKADDVPARLSKNEFVFTADAVRAAGGGDVDAGAEVMENVMENLEAGGKVSEESQGLEGAQEMFANAQQLQKRII